MTTIGSSARVEGKIEGSEDVNVLGTVDGTITLAASLTIAQGGFVSGDIKAESVTIDGAVTGTVTADYIHLTASARDVADLTAGVLNMEDGAQLSGDVTMDLDGVVPAKRTASASAKPAAEKPASKSKKDEPVLEETTEIGDDEDDSDEYYDSYEEMTVKELRDLLREYDEPTTGTKSELIERLEALEE